MRKKLLGSIFHLTRQSSLSQILKDGHIAHNQDARFGLNTSSQNSFGRNRGYVCLFDFQNITEEILEDIIRRYYVYSPSWFEEIVGENKVWKLAYLFVDPKIYDRIIPNEAASSLILTNEPNRFFIPHAECWYDGNLPLRYIKKIIKVNVILPLTERDRLFLAMGRLRR